MADGRVRSVTVPDRLVGDFDMNADWYVDPLGRYEGRFFDGEEWTAQVKERGRLVVDPDWDRAPEGDSDEDITADFEITGTDAHVPAEPIVGTPEFVEDQAAAVAPVMPAAVADAVVASGEPDYQTESPARQVAVLESPIEPVAETPADGAMAGVTDAEPSGSRRWLYLVGAGILIVGLLLALLPRLFGSDDVADADDGSVEAVEIDEADGTGLPVTDTDGDDGEPTEDATEPVDADGAVEADGTAENAQGTTEATEGDDSDGDDEAAATDPETTPDTSEDPAPVTTGDGIGVGSLTILNGTPVLRDLEIWHASSLTDRDVELGDSAGCWFGSIGEAVVQNAHCGPVAATPGAEPRFDLIPLRFEDIEDGVIQVRPITDAVVIDAVLPNGLDLVGADGTVDMASFAAATGTDADSNDATDPDEEADTGRGSRGEREPEDG